MANCEVPQYELHRHHHKALSNPAYMMDGLQDVMREELSHSLPYSPVDCPTREDYSGLEERIAGLENIPLEVAVNAKVYDRLQQLERRIEHYINKQKKVRPQKEERGIVPR